MQKPPGQDLAILLTDVGRLLRTRADQLARSRGMTRAQWVILSRLERQPGMTQAEMAALCEVEPITVARLVDRLEARNLLERRSDPRDRRVRRLYLRPAADPVLAELKEHGATILDLLTDGLDSARVSQLVETLLQIKSNLGGKTVEPDRAAAAAE